MKIRTRLTLIFTLLFAFLLIGFALFIYYSSAQTREDEYYKRLHQQAITKANLLLDARVAPGVLQLIYRNSPNSLFQEEVAIYDTSFHLLYHDAVDIDKIKETYSMIREIVQKGEIRFGQGSLQAVGLLYPHNGRDYVITAAAIDEYGLVKLKNLKITLIISTTVCLLLTVLAGLFFSRQALRPVATIVDKVEEITATNLDQRVPVINSRDEIGELAFTFNAMLDRLENSFEAQKQFVSNISHELRTPLSAIVAELELASAKERTVEEYQRSLKQARMDAQKITRLSNSLLDLAKASYDQREITFKVVRLDEVLLDARQLVQLAHPEYKVNIIYEGEWENEEMVSVKGNEYLLKVAFANLIENGCKFSWDRQSTVSISFLEGNTILNFSDTGIGIPDDDLPHLFTPFFRGGNKDHTEGNGIGLSLTHKIITLHHGAISVSTSVGQGSSFRIELPHL